MTPPPTIMGRQIDVWIYGGVSDHVRDTHHLWRLFMMRIT